MLKSPYNSNDISFNLLRGEKSILLKNLIKLSNSEILIINFSKFLKFNNLYKKNKE